MKKNHVRSFLVFMLIPVALLFLLPSCGLLFYAGAEGISSINEGAANKRFAPEKMEGISILIDDPSEIQFNSKREITIKARILHKEKTYEYIAAKDDKSAFKLADMEITVTGATYENGTIKVNRKLTEIPDGKVVIHAKYILNPQMDTTLIIDMLNGKKGSAMYSGKVGYGGSSGSNGASGGSYSTGCKDGAHGSHGSDGYDGGDGYAVFVYTKLIYSESLKKQVLAIKSYQENDKDTSYQFIDPSTSEFNLYAVGGNGGYGGSGGKGGDGGYHKEGATLISNCRGGDGGDGGNGGRGGNGGTITVYYDPSAKAYLEKIKLNNQGGYGGSAGDGGGGGRNGDTWQSLGRKGRVGRSGQDGKPGPSPSLTETALGNELFL